MVPSMTSMVPYEHTLPSTHNSFGMLSHDELQEDLIVHAKFAINKDQNRSTLEVGSQITEPVPQL